MCVLCALQKENGQNLEQPLTTLSVFRDARLCARVFFFFVVVVVDVVVVVVFFLLLAFFNGFSATAINRKIPTIFKF